MSDGEVDALLDAYLARKTWEAEVQAAQMARLWMEHFADPHAQLAAIRGVEALIKHVLNPLFGKSSTPSQRSSGPGSFAEALQAAAREQGVDLRQTAIRESEEDGSQAR